MAPRGPSSPVQQVAADEATARTGQYFSSPKAEQEPDRRLLVFEWSVVVATPEAISLANLGFDEELRPLMPSRPVA
jgi:hypothetical protein